MLGITISGSAGWEAVLTLTLLMMAAYMVAVWAGLVFWTWQDIRRRTTNSSEQLFAVGIVGLFFIAGWVVYLLLRPQSSLEDGRIEQLEYDVLSRELVSRQACTRCGRRVSDDFMVCPYCRTELRTKCQGCARPVELTWSACAYCGRGVQRAPAPAPAPVPAAAASRPRTQPFQRPAFRAG